jgi:hypothetical protein
MVYIFSFVIKRKLFWNINLFDRQG